MSRERPILFSAPMVRAILEGRKTQTRRVVKPQPNNPEVFGVSPIWGSGARRDSDRFSIHAATNVGGKRVDAWIDCPFGDSGDLLWVRETWRDLEGDEGDTWVEYRADGTKLHSYFRLNTARRQLWRPSIFMPKWAARIWLEVTGVRVERLADISPTDAIAEGLTEEASPDVPVFGVSGLFSADFADPRDAYRELWQSINGPESWDTNPWVWVIEFKRAERKAVAV